MRTVGWILGLSLCCWGCGGDDTCVLGSVEGCGDGLTCESFAGEPQCTQPVVIAGRVFDLLDDGGIAEARIVARDANGGARSGVTFSAADGTYQLPVSIARDAEGRPLDDQITLRVDASGYETFPSPPRQALPIDLTGATMAEDQWTIMNAATDVGLIPRSDRSGSTISGTVVHADPGGVLVVGEQGGTAVATSITGTDGAFVLYDVPPGETVITGYRQGLGAGPVTVTSVPEGLVDVALNGVDATAIVSGSVTLVNAPGGLETSVILIVASTLDTIAIRGESPAGLRAAPVSSDFVIENVPPGRYAVLAGFENDLLVRDPDEGIAGTDVVVVDVTGDLDIMDSFKVTEALEVISPGADGLEVVTSPPDLVWAQDSSEEGYEVRVFDALGALVHEDTMVPDGTGSMPITYPLDGVITLTPGMIYQFRAFSFGRGSLLSGTEDLRGVFQYSP